MNDLHKKYQELNLELLKNFVFYIPFELIDNQIFYQTIDTLNLQVTQKMVEKYVDMFLIFDDNLNIKEVESYETLIAANGEKIIKLSNNSFELAQLKDTLGTASFNFIFDKYLEQLNTYSEITEMLVENYDILYPNTIKVPKNMIILQQNILKTHLEEIEKKVGIIAEKLSSTELITNIVKNEPFNQFIEKKSNKNIVKIKPFIDFIKHDNKVEIEKIIKTHYSDFRGVSLRYLIEFLKEEGLLIINYGDAMKLHTSFTELFDGKNIGAYSTIFDNKVFSSKDVKYINAKATFAKTFKNVL